MNGEQRVQIGWDRQSGAWRVAADPAGPAGTAELSFGAVSWRCDWADPTRVVDVLVVPQPGAGTSIDQRSLDRLTTLLGADVTAALTVLVEADDVVTVAGLVPATTAVARRHLGLAAVASERAAAAGGLSWWVIEEVAALSSAGIEPDPGALDLAFDLADRMPNQLVDALSAGGLAGPLRTTMLLSGIPDNELPPGLRLPDEDVGDAFERLVGNLDLDDLVEAGSASTGSRRRPPREFRISAADDIAVDWIDVPVGRFVSARADDSDSGIVVEVGLTGAAPTGCVARLIDIGGRAPIVLADAPLAPYRVDNSTVLRASLPVPGGRLDSTRHRVELTRRPVDQPLAAPVRARRHATNVARSAMIVERQSRTRIRGSDDLSSLRAAARAWIGAATAWEAAGDPSRQIESLRRAAELFAVLGPTGRADAEEALTRSERARAAAAEDRPEPFDPHPSAGIGWAEPAIAVVEQYLADSLDANDDGLALDDDELDRLAVVAESIDQLLVAAHLRLILRDRQDPASRAWRHLGRLASEYHRSLGLEVDPGGGDA